MAFSNVNLGTVGNDGTGDSMRAAFTKVNANFANTAPLASPVFTGLPVAPTAANTVSNTQIATTAFVQNVIRNNRDVTWFGADPTGNTDSTTAINNAFANGVYNFPAGTFLASANLVVPNTAYGIVEGKGIGATTLKFSNGCLDLPCTGALRYHSKGVTGLTVATTSAGTNTAIYVHSTSSIDTKIVLRDIEIIGWDGVYGGNTGPAQYWGTGIDLTEVRFVSMDNVTIHGGGAGKSATGLKIRSANTSSQFGFFGNALEIDGFTAGVDVDGWIEGIYWSNFEIFGCRDGFKGNHNGTTVGTWKFTNGHINASQTGFEANNVSGIGLYNMNIARGYIEAGFNTAYQAGGVLGNTSYGYYYAGDTLRIKNATSDGQVTIDGGEYFSAFAETDNIIKLDYVTRFSISSPKIYGAGNNAIHLANTCTKGGWDEPIIDEYVFNLNTGIYIANTCSDITGGAVYFNNANTKLSDPGDVLGKYRPRFLAYLGATASNVTGAGAFYYPICDTVVYNNGSAYNSTTGAFVAQVAGIYYFRFAVEMIDMPATASDGYLSFETPNGTRSKRFYPPAAGGPFTLEIDVQVSMAVGDYVAPRISVSGGAGNTLDLNGGGVNNTTFEGYLAKAY